MKFSGKIEDGTSIEPIKFGSKLLPCRRVALSECTLRAKICALRVLITIIIITVITFFFFFVIKKKNPISHIGYTSS